MTSKEAKSILNAYRNRNYNYNFTFRDELELAKAIDVVLPKYVELEARDTPAKTKRIIKIYDIEEAHCAICNSTVELKELIKVDFCPKCGQRIDWSDL